MTLVRRFNDFIRERNLFQKNDLLLVAVSGGMDSVSLCELCHQSGFNFEIAHCNFQLRGEDSTRDENFTEQLAKNYHVPFHLQRFDTKAYAEQNKLSTQEAARNLRYDWFRSLLEVKRNDKQNAFLLTAHHANDAIETLLMNFFKGTGMHGLQGIPKKNGRIRRPLLFATRNEITEFIDQHQLKFVEDISNSSDKYTRNYFRNKLIPSIAEVFPRVEENLLNNLSRFEDAGVLYEKALSDIRIKLVEEKGEELHLPVLKVLKTPAYKTVLFEILKEFHFLSAQLPDVVNLLHAESGKYVDSTTHRVLRNRKWLIISPKHTISVQHILITNDDHAVPFLNGIIRIVKKEWQADMKLETDMAVALIDAADVTFPLLLRPWRQGDYFYPLGMKHKKKLSRFFIDQKLSIADKEKIWVLECRKKILWIVGMRIDDRFKITNTTKQVLRLHWVTGQ